MRPLLDALTDTHLLEERTPGRYAFHDLLLRAYTTEQAQTHDTDAARHTAVHRLLDDYLHSMHAAVRLCNPTASRSSFPRPPRGSTPESVPDPERAEGWIAVEHPVLLAAVEQAAGAGFDTHALQLAWLLWGALNFGGHWHEQLALQRLALHATARRRIAPARRTPTTPSPGPSPGWKDPATPPGTYQHAIDLYRAVGDSQAQAHAHQNLSWGALPPRPRRRVPRPPLAGARRVPGGTPGAFTRATNRLRSSSTTKEAAVTAMPSTVSALSTPLPPGDLAHEDVRGPPVQEPVDPLQQHRREEAADEQVAEQAVAAGHQRGDPGRGE